MLTNVQSSNVKEQFFHYEIRNYIYSYLARIVFHARAKIKTPVDRLNSYFKNANSLYKHSCLLFMYFVNCSNTSTCLIVLVSTLNLLFTLLCYLFAFEDENTKYSLRKNATIPNIWKKYVLKNTKYHVRYARRFFLKSCEQQCW